jgi:hypothetical protein
VPTPPSPFFDGTRLGLEGTMLSIAGVSVPAGLHIALSVVLGYPIRLGASLPPAPNEFTLFGFLFAALIAIVAMAMLIFFMLAIPTMAYSMGLVAVMLRWVGKRWGREKLASTIMGAVLGLLVGIGSSALVLLMMDLRPAWPLYIEAFRWPQVLTVDGIALLWVSLNPLFNAAGGAQIGWRLGAQVEELALYYFW